MNNQKKRLFIGTPLSEELSLDLISYTEIFASDGKIVPKENLHLTLLFLGVVEEPCIKDIIIQVEQVFKNYHSIFLEAKGITCVPPNSPRMVWLEFKKNQIFTNLVQDLANTLSQFVHRKLQKKQVIPHVTLVRLKKTTSVVPKKANQYKGTKNMIIDSAGLYESKFLHNEVFYKKLESFSLKK
ncbi:MAG: hypothetical protein KatS3mg089_0342 [Patescibacteria group bacterium]|nr:MAG: hypothetical protein KatS3mg089_0342 [Patescibacteria group bacterium]